MMNNNLIDYSNLRPLIGQNGKPVKDADNNYVLLDEQNRPVKNTGITLLLDQSGKPVLNSKSRPILIDSEGKPINLESNDLNIPLNSLINPELYYQNPQGQMNNNKLMPKQKPAYYEKINSVPKKPNKKIKKKRWW